MSAYPNAGLPDQFGEYRETPHEMARLVKPVLANRSVNIIGGCCGTTPDHIRALSQLAAKASVRPRPVVPKNSGLADLSLFKLMREAILSILVNEPMSQAPVNLPGSFVTKNLTKHSPLPGTRLKMGLRLLM